MTQRQLHWQHKPKATPAQRIAIALARGSMPALHKLADELGAQTNLETGAEDSEELRDVFDAQCALETEEPLDKPTLAMCLARMAADAKRAGEDPGVIQDLTDALKTLRARRS